MNLSGMMGGGMTREERNMRYFGNPPEGTYPKHADLAHIHDLHMAPQQIKRLYGVGPSEQVVEARYGTDSKQGLITELVEETSFTRREAEEFVSNWMVKNDLQEYDDPILGKYIASKGGRDR